jgi:hypothetical protein
MNRFSGWWPNVWAFLGGLGLGLMVCGHAYASSGMSAAPPVGIIDDGPTECGRIHEDGKPARSICDEPGLPRSRTYSLPHVVDNSYHYWRQRVDALGNKHIEGSHDQEYWIDLEATAPPENFAICTPEYHCWQEPLVHPSDMVCLEKMEKAMRAVDPFLAPSSGTYGTYDGCNYCGWGEGGGGSCTLVACGDGPERELRRLEYEVDQTKKQIEREKQRTEALKEWASVKDKCWSKP